MIACRPARGLGVPARHDGPRRAGTDRRMRKWDAAPIRGDQDWRLAVFELEDQIRHRLPLVARFWWLHEKRHYADAKTSCHREQIGCQRAARLSSETL